VAVIQGENAPLTCVVRELGDATVVWKKWENGKSGPKILTAGEIRVTSDDRIRIIHDNGKEKSMYCLCSIHQNNIIIYLFSVDNLF